MASVLIIAKNQAELEAIKKLADEKGYEIIVVGENPPDKAEEPVAEYGTKENFKNMKNLIIEVNSENDLLKIQHMLAGIGVSFKSESDYEFQRQMHARKEFVEWAESLPKYDITNEEIQSIVEEVRSERYGREKKD